MRFTHSALVCAAMFAVAAPVRAAGPVAAPFGEDNPLVLQTQPAVGATLRTPATPAQLRASLLLGADYLQQMQADITEDNAGNGSGVGETPNDPEDGGWDWVVNYPAAPIFHTTAASPGNTYGATVLGLYRGYLLTGDAGYFTALTDAANAAVAAGTANIRTASDMIFLMLYNDLPGVAGTAYKDAARAKYDFRVGGAGGATAWAEYIRNVRGASYPNGIIPWDVAPYVVAATMLDERFGGYAADADAMAEVLWQDSFNDSPGYFDVVDDAGWDPSYVNSNYWYYNLGISGLIDAFVASDTHTAELPWLVGQLTGSQYASGAISFSYGANTGDEDWQSTAYAAMALGRHDAWAYGSQVVMMGTYLYATQDVGVTNGWRYLGGDHYPEVGGEATAGLYFAYLAGDYVEAVPSGSPNGYCPCAPVAVDFVRTDVAAARGASVTFTLSPELALCSGTASIKPGTWLSGYTNKTFLVVDNLDGTYTVDQSILGMPCGITTGGQLFTLDLMATGPSGAGTVTITDVIVRDCANHPLPGIPGAPAAILVDVIGPTAMTDLTATQVKVGNDSDGTTKIQLNFTAPGDAASAMVYRKGYGFYPEYDDAGGAVPAVPTSPGDAVTNGWMLTGVAAGGTDEPTTRDFWYYVAFTQDACGNVSAPSNMAGGRLNYHLGDVSNGITQGQGNNVVNGQDISLLGAHYGITLVPADTYNYLDVGPTTDYSVDARPTTDNKVNFEDLMMFAINHMTVSRTPATSATEVAFDEPSLALAVTTSGDRVFARLSLDDHVSRVQGVHAFVQYDAKSLQLVGVTKGELAGGQSFLGTIPGSGGVSVDVAQLGNGVTFEGNGEVAVVEFRRLGGTSLPSLGEAALRDSSNRPATRRPVGDLSSDPAVATTAPAITRVQLVGARPNPFTSSTDIAFRIPSASTVTVRIHDVTGRLVRTVLDRSLPAGEHTARWDGRTDQGLRVGSGIYFYTFRAGDVQETRKILVTR